MPFQKVQSEKLSHAVVRQIELLILQGILRPGERLPSERELSDKLGVSRPSLREAIATLQDQGLLDSRAGAGIFVADVLGASLSPALTKLFATHDEAVEPREAGGIDIGRDQAVGHVNRIATPADHEPYAFFLGPGDRVVDLCDPVGRHVALPLIGRKQPVGV